MPDLRLVPRTPLREQLSPRRIGRRGGEAGISVYERTALSLTLITARRSMRKACTEKLRASYEIDAPAISRIVHGKGLSLAWAGPESWLAVTPEQSGAKLETILGDAAAIVDVSDACVVLRLGGPMARALLAKGVDIDLHPRAFTAGDAAMTLLAHIAVHLWQVDEKPTFDLAVPRATARDVFHWLTVSTAEFGLDIGANRA